VQQAPVQKTPREDMAAELPKKRGNSRLRGPTTETEYLSVPTIRETSSCIWTESLNLNQSLGLMRMPAPPRLRTNGGALVDLLLMVRTMSDSQRRAFASC
jgi:hypothetical protein